MDEYETLSRICENFVIYSTHKFDISHGVEHMWNVLWNTEDICDNDGEILCYIKQYPNIKKDAMILSWIHDIRDHKYRDVCISEKELYMFL
jgi:hypothetical protein